MPLLALVVWEACARAGLMVVVLPAPSAVAAKWWDSLLPMQPYDPAQMGYLAWLFSGEMIHDAISSMYRVVVGFLVGAGLALPLGLVMGANPRLYALFNPLLQGAAPDPADCLHSAGHPVVWHGQPRRRFPDLDRRVFRC